MTPPQILTDPLYIALAVAENNLTTQKGLPLCEDTRDKVEQTILRHLSLEVQMAVSPATWNYYRITLPDDDFLGTLLVLSYQDYPAVAHPDFIRGFLRVVWSVTGIRFVSISSGTLDTIRLEFTEKTWKYQVGKVSGYLE